MSPARPASIPPDRTDKNHSAQNTTRSSPRKIPSDPSAHNAAPSARSRASPTHISRWPQTSSTPPESAAPQTPALGRDTHAPARATPSTADHTASAARQNLSHPEYARILPAP